MNTTLRMTLGRMFRSRQASIAVLVVTAIALSVLTFAPAVAADDPPFSAYPPPPPGASFEGDANGDDCVNIVDAMFIAQYTVGIREFDARAMLASDTTSDGDVNIVDAMHIAQYTVDPEGSAGVLFKPIWEWPADAALKDPADPSQNGG